VPNRSPQFGEIDIPAALATHSVNGASVVADQTGLLTWPDGATSLIPGFVGKRVAVDSGTTPLPRPQLTLVPNGTSVLTSTKDSDLSAMTAYVTVNITKQFVKQALDPNQRYVDAVVPVTVNEDFECNAFSSGDDIHFANKSADCINTGLLSDVIHHEFGHSLHTNSLTPGVGQFDGSASEGLADVLSLSITEEPSLGAGFFNAFPNVPVRDLDPDYGDKKYPDNATGEEHDEGELIAESLWDMRRALVSALGKEAGVARANKIFYAIMQRCTGITTAYPEALLADDDDGNIRNGTPNQCLIKAAFGRHGLADAQIGIPTVVPSRDGFTVSAAITAGTPAIANCASPALVGGTVNWHLKGDPSIKGSVPLVATGATAAAVIPTQPDGSVVQYKLAADLSDGSTATFPFNRADQEYEFYVGPADPLWCADFDAAGNKGGMTTTADWEVGVATAAGITAGDATAPFSGAGMLGTILAGDGSYRAATKSKATLPVVDLAKYSHVRLQFMRWISVNDAETDQAAITVAGTTKWTNPKRKMPTNDTEAYASPTIVLQDKEWRFVDVDLGDPATGIATNSIDFTLVSDGQDQRGGWNLDHLCVVGTQGIIGDGQVVAGEECDDGNTINGDGCSDQGKIEESDLTPAGCCAAQRQSIGGIAGTGAMALLVAMGVRPRRRSVV
jgi:cysteine-rich repeat protein